MTHDTSLPRFRPFHFGVTRGIRRDTPAATYLQAEAPLLPYAHRMTDRLLYWAQTTPERTLFARRDPALNGDWRHLTFAAALDSARRIGQALLDRGLNADRPLVILSENSLEHAVLALGAMYAGVPFCAASPA
ncbi:MAG: feruloyl-CoA synthase, partial [Polaromonas sp.]|nr:feruloyl-CoA synthase [Polaromonas sp.]